MDDGDAPNIVTWRFKIGQSASPPSTPQFDRPTYVISLKCASDDFLIPSIVHSGKVPLVT
jgi:hypothetical protein